MELRGVGASPKIAVAGGGRAGIHRARSASPSTKHASKRVSPARRRSSISIPGHRPPCWFGKIGARRLAVPSASRAASNFVTRETFRRGLAQEFLLGGEDNSSVRLLDSSGRGLTRGGFLERDFRYRDPLVQALCRRSPSTLSPTVFAEISSFHRPTFRPGKRDHVGPLVVLGEGRRGRLRRRSGSRLDRALNDRELREARLGAGTWPVAAPTTS